VIIRPHATPCRLTFITIQPSNPPRIKALVRNQARCHMGAGRLWWADGPHPQCAEAAAWWSRPPGGDGYCIQPCCAL